MNLTNEIQYSQYFVAFLDILGFRNFVFDKKHEKINTYFSLIKEITNDLKQISSKKDIGSITISDSVILSMPVDDDSQDNIENFRQLCIAIQKIQFKLALHNIWLRGAVSFGDAYFSARENQVVGKAYINAYELERDIAIYPRVVIDSRLIEKLNFNSSSDLINKINNHRLCNTEYEPRERNIIFKWNYSHGHPRKGIPNDVALFIDYLVYAFESETDLAKLVTNIGESIYTDNKTYSKFRWIADYLIMCCDFHNQHGSNISQETIQRECKRLMQI